MTSLNGRARTALVTGATGVIGPGLVQRLVAGGYRVRVLARSPVPARLLPDSITVITGDITDGARVAEAIDGVDYVFHLAAKLHINSPSPSLRGEYRRVNVDGTRVVTAAAAAVGVQRLVFFSTIAVYGASRHGEILTEQSEVSPDTLYSTTKRDAEQVVLAARRPDGSPLGVVLRVAGVYGPRIKGNYRELVRWIERGIFLPVGTGKNRRTLVHDTDVAAAAVLAAEHPAAAGKVFNVTDGSIHTFSEIVGAIVDVLGKRPPLFAIPAPLARTAAVVVDGALQIGGGMPKAAALVEKVVEDMAVSGTRIQQVLGFKPAYDLRAGWRATIPQLMKHE